jgi:hypothetical protein
MKLVVDMDMREVNQFMGQKHFKMEGTPTLEDLLQPNIHAGFTYCGMPFGLYDAPRVFTKIMKQCAIAIREI